MRKYRPESCRKKLGVMARRHHPTGRVLSGYCGQFKSRSQRLAGIRDLVKVVYVARIA
jgi:hypothetical protein